MNAFEPRVVNTTEIPTLFLEALRLFRRRLPGTLLINFIVCSLMLPIAELIFHFKYYWLVPIFYVISPIALSVFILRAEEVDNNKKYKLTDYVKSICQASKTSVTVSLVAVSAIAGGVILVLLFSGFVELICSLFVNVKVVGPGHTIFTLLLMKLAHDPTVLWVLWGGMSYMMFCYISVSLISSTYCCCALSLFSGAPIFQNFRLSLRAGSMNFTSLLIPLMFLSILSLFFFISLPLLGSIYYVVYRYVFLGRKENNPALKQNPIVVNTRTNSLTI